MVTKNRTVRPTDDALFRILYSLRSDHEPADAHVPGKIATRAIVLKHKSQTGEEKPNSRNGHSQKTVITSYKDVSLVIPRNRNGGVEQCLFH